MMELLLVVTTIFLAVVLMFISTMFAIVVYKLAGQDINIPFLPKGEDDRFTPDNIERPFESREKIPLDHFRPRTDIPLTVKISDEDKITKLSEND